MKREGIDVSKWQGAIDWEAVKASGIEFVIIKAGGSDNGIYKDRMFESNYAGAKAAGLLVGAYYFVGPKCLSYEDGEADARRFLDFIAGKEFDYPVYIDIESTSPDDKAEATDAVIGFCETMEDAGYYAGIYASDVSGFVDRLDDSQLQDYTHWVARYGNNPKMVKDYGIWQKSSSGKINGISGNVDLDESYVEFEKVIYERFMNGFIKPEEEEEEVVVEKTLEERIAELESRVTALEEVL